jgi:pimeloyl-ACP methyl ester carboxylesterase
MSKIIKTVVIVLVTTVLGTMSYNLITYKNTSTVSAIIYLPGVVGSGLIDSNGDPVWDPYDSDHTIDELWGDGAMSMVLDFLFGEEYSSTTSSILSDILEGNSDSILKLLTPTEDGDIVDNGIVAASSTTSLSCGALNAYKNIYDGLYEEFNEDVPVYFFQYDWRQDIRISGEELEEFINDNGFDEVIICAHSMGNLVVSNYLARSEENRDKTKSYMALAGPFYGSTEVLSLYENPYSYLDAIMDIVNNNNILKNLFGDSIEDIFENQFLPLLYNMASVGQMLPTIEYSNALKEYYGTAFITTDGQEITTNEQLMEFYLSRPWAKKTDGELRKFMTEFADFQDSYMVDVDGEEVHSSYLVDTLYFVGTGVNTEVAINMVNGEYSNSIYENLGDGVVPLYSATLGRSIDTEYIKVYEGYGHGDVGMYIDNEAGQDLCTAIRYVL